ncbi:MAG: MiaB/RimO family radical SAM methylthiotransferase [Planctomycetota bacterium]|nr:MiaB/RimO family radical SAM methylthiotransferase [Planctomycetota bacterium]
MNHRSVYLETFGCQMNELDSELVKGQLESLGYRLVDRDAGADVVLYNTCSVREQAENKAWSRIGVISNRKRAGEEIILGVLGCMAERDGHDLLRRHPEVDLMCGPGELDRLPLLLDNISRARGSELNHRGPIDERVALGGNRSRRWSTLQAAGDNLELLDLSRAFNPDPGARAAGRSAYVRITRGCNKFCTYCVVPHTRGAEVHRPPGDIVEECRTLADRGVIEITLLGQTVNHYCYTHGVAVSVSGRELAQVGPGLKSFEEGNLSSKPGARTTSFAELLELIHERVPEIRRLRFVTSYPRDFSDEALDVIARCERICPYLHVPAQSGSDRILKLMNRGYSLGQYLEFIDRAQARIPDVSIAGDVIVGFPTETEEDFEDTIRLLRRVPFKNNFIFKYSERPGTVARRRFEDDVPIAVKKQRNNRLLAVQAEVSAEVHARWVGRTTEVLVEQVSKQERSRGKRHSQAQALPGQVTLTSGGAALEPQPGAGEGAGAEEPGASIQLSGRTPGDLIVFLDCPRSHQPERLIGTIQKVHIEDSSALSLSGTLI